MVEVTTPRRDQLVRMANNDWAAAQLLENLFRVAGTEIPGAVEAVQAEVAALDGQVSANTAAIAANAAAVLLRLIAGNNLSDLPDAAAARVNLGLGALAVLNSIATAQINNGAVTVPKIGATGTPAADTYLRGDGSWSGIVTGVYTMATLPPPVQGGLIYITDEMMGATHASGDGTNWRRVSDRQIVMNPL